MNAIPFRLSSRPHASSPAAVVYGQRGLASGSAATVVSLSGNAGESDGLSGVCESG